MKMNSTAYKIILLIAFLLSPFFAYSQNATRHQMDNIKRDKRFLTSTETHAETESEAIDEALKKLSYVVNRYIRDSTDLKTNASNLGLEEKEEQLVLLEDGVYYVLIYVPKSLILELSGNQTPTEEKVTDSPNIVSPPISSITTEGPSPSESSNDTTEWAIELAEWQREVMEELLSCKDINTTMSKLQQMKDYFKVQRWGAGKSCPDAAKAYWIVFDANQSLVTILGPGTDKRMDFRTANSSSLNNYKNMNAIWFYLSK